MGTMTGKAEWISDGTIQMCESEGFECENGVQQVQTQMRTD